MRPGHCAFRRLAAAVILSAVHVVRKGYQLGRPLQQQSREVQDALAFLRGGVDRGPVRLSGARPAKQRIRPYLWHEIARQEVLAEMGTKSWQAGSVGRRTGSGRQPLPEKHYPKGGMTSDPDHDADASLKGERLLPTEALCARWRCHKATVLRYVRAGRLKAVRLSELKLLFRVADAVKFERGGTP